MASAGNALEGGDVECKTLRMFFAQRFGASAATMRGERITVHACFSIWCRSVRYALLLYAANGRWQANYIERRR